MISISGGSSVLTSPVSLLSAWISGDGPVFSAHFQNESVFRVLDTFDMRLLDEAHGPAGSESLLRRLHENVEFISFRVIKMKWIAGGISYEWRAQFRNWGFGPSRQLSGFIKVFFTRESVHFVEVHLDGEAYLDLVHDGRAPLTEEVAPRQARRAAL